MPLDTKKLRDLITMATTDSGNIEERRNAAMAACELLKSNDVPEEGLVALGTSASVHPNAEKIRAWKRCVKRLDLQNVEVKQLPAKLLGGKPLSLSVCAKCGEPIKPVGQIRITSTDGFKWGLLKESLWTHDRCKEWWLDYQDLHVPS